MTNYWINFSILGWRGSSRVVFYRWKKKKNPPTHKGIEHAATMLYMKQNTFKWPNKTFVDHRLIWYYIIVYSFTSLVWSPLHLFELHTKDMKKKLWVNHPGLECNYHPSWPLPSSLQLLKPSFKPVCSLLSYQITNYPKHIPALSI